MKKISKNKFFEITANFECVPYTQTLGWQSFFRVDEKENFLFLVDNEEKPKMACVGHVKKSLGLKMLLIEGECFQSKKYKANLVKSFYEGIPQLGFDMVEVVSNTIYNSDFEVGIRRAGFLRPVGSFSMPLSNWVNLTEDIKYNSNWTRNYKKSKEHTLTFELFDKPSEDLMQKVVRFYNAFTKEKGFGHQLSYEATKRLLNSDNFSLGIVTSKSKELLSFIIIHQSNAHAGLLYAAKSDAAKENAATFFMYKELFEILKLKGFVSFDMEKLVPSTHSTDGVFLFKDGVKGERVVYNGEWSWYKKSLYRPLMYFVKKWLFKEREI